MSCGVGCRLNLDSELLWLWHRPLAWEPLGTALEKTKKQKTKNEKKKREENSESMRKTQDNTAGFEDEGGVHIDPGDINNNSLSLTKL